MTFSGFLLFMLRLRNHPLLKLHLSEGKLIRRQIPRLDLLPAGHDMLLLLHPHHHKEEDCRERCISVEERLQESLPKLVHFLGTIPGGGVLRNARHRQPRPPPLRNRRRVPPRRRQSEVHDLLRQHGVPDLPLALRRVHATPDDAGSALRGRTDRRHGFECPVGGSEPVFADRVIVGEGAVGRPRCRVGLQRED